MWKYSLLIVLGMGFSLVLTPISRQLAFWIGAIDTPGERRIHVIPTPRFGGPAILMALVLAVGCAPLIDHWVASALRLESAKLTALLVGALMVTLVGAIDDVRPLRPFTKLMVEIAAASVAVYGGYRIDFWSGFHLQFLSFPLSVSLIVAAINAVNLVDGLDGLAVGLCLIITATLFFLCLSTGQVASALLLAAVGGALLGFLPYNFQPARIFLGDSGALLLGFLVGVGAISTSHKMASAVAIAAPFLALGLPLGELMLTTVRRILRAVHVVRLDEDVQRYDFLFTGRPALFSADRDHIHHRLLSFGIGHRRAVLLLYCVSLSICAVAFVMATRDDLHQGALLGALVIAAVAGVRWLGYREFSPLRAGLLLPFFDFSAVNRKLVHLLTDLIFIGASYTFAFLIQYPIDSATRVIFLVSLPVIVTVQMASFVLSGLYKRSYRHAGVDDVFGVMKALGLAVGAGWIATALLPPAPRLGVIVLDAYMLTTLVLGSRLSFRLLDHLFERQPPNARRVLIYGAGRGGAAAFNEIRTNASLAMTVVGFLDDDVHRCGFRLQGIKIHHPQALPDMIRSEEFDAVVLASAKIKAARVQILAEQCKRAGLPVMRFEINWEDAGAAGPAATASPRRVSPVIPVRSVTLHH